MILASYDDYIKAHGENLAFSKMIEQILDSEPEIYMNIIEYWACEGNDIEDCFAITQFIRLVKSNM